MTKVVKRVIERRPEVTKMAYTGKVPMKPTVIVAKKKTK